MSKKTRKNYYSKPNIETQVQDKNGIMNLLFTSGILISIATFLAYIFCYAYELGFAMIFHIPMEFIVFDMFTIIKDFYIILIALMVVVVAAGSKYFLYKVLHIEPIYIYISIFISIANIVAIVFVFVTYDSKILNATLPIIFIILILTAWILIRLARSGRITIEAESNSWNLFNFKSKYAQVLFILVLLFISISLFNIFGKLEAKTQIPYYTFTSTQSTEMVVLRMYGNNLICAPLNKVSQTVDSKFVFMKTDDLSKDRITIKYENIGPLKITRDISMINK